MNLFLVSNFLVSLTSLVLILILTFYGKAKIHRIWALCNIAIFCWGIGTILFSWTDKISIAAIGWKIGYAGGIFISTFYYHTVYILTSDKPNLKNRKFLWFSYIFAIIASSLTLIKGNLVMPGFRLMFDSIYYPLATPIYSIIFLVWGSIAFFASYQLYRFMRLSKGIESVKAKYLLFAFSIGFIGGGSAHLPSWGIPVYPLSNFGVAFYAIIGTYAILKHQLMEIEVIIKKTLVFASLFAIVLGVFVGITVLTQEILAGGRLLGLAISSIIIILIVRPLENFLISITDKFLFQKKYDYKQILKSFIDEVITVLNLDRVIQSTIELLDKTLHPENSAILLLNHYENRYVSYKTSGYNKDIILENNSKIVTLLKATRDIFSIGKSETPIKITEELKDEMKALNARLAIPFMLHNDLIGIMLLGKKRSDEEYTKEDLDILTDLARTEAIAIGNAQLFAETAQNERRAAIGTLAAGINHEVGNPLNIISTKMQIYLMSLERGLCKGKKPEDVIKESKDIMNICLQQTERISEITRKLSNFARPSKEFRPELTDIEEQLNETLSVVGHELELERIDIKKDIQKPLPRILADKRQIQQIFFNIIKNAGQAIKEKGVIEIKTYSSVDGKIKNVKIEVSDTGHGIPEDRLDKIYDPFFTTKDPERGTGLGLSIVRQLVWRNRGDIKVKSKVGEGTVFTLTFPEAK